MHNLYLSGAGSDFTFDALKTAFISFVTEILYVVQHVLSLIFKKAFLSEKDPDQIYISYQYKLLHSKDYCIVKLIPIFAFK